MKNWMNSYILLAAATVGYYGYLPQVDENRWMFQLMWAIMFLVGLVSLARKNHSFYKQTNSLLVFVDALWIILLMLLPNFEIGRGIILFLTTTLAILSAMKISKLKNRKLLELENK